MKSLLLRLVLAALVLLALPVQAARYGLLDVQAGQQAPARPDVLAGALDDRFVDFRGAEREPDRDRREAWIRIEPEAGDANGARVLVVRRTPVDSLGLYLRDGNAWREVASGMRADRDAPFNVCCFAFELPPLRPGQPMYLHVRDATPSPVSLSLDTPRALAERDRGETVLVTAVLTTMFAMMFVNMLFWVVLRGSAWLHYSLFLLFNALWLANSDFLLARVPLLRDIDPAAMFPWSLLGAFAAFFATTFLQRFVELPQFRPRLSRVLDVGRWLVLAVALATFFE
ncbi:MAG TPA: 7TM diverse intracellular signaling domain-containing protein, partial [Xanthomonadales bacterium]|nr:7TM diverse intracellular signaling domain-containing protein [Xanthomonadales bacterium]